jgi:glutathione S-transferase
MLRLWGRISSINVRKVVLCAQVLGLDFECIDAGLSWHREHAGLPAPDPRSRAAAGRRRLQALGIERSCATSVPARVHRFTRQDLQARFNAERWMDGSRPN